MAVEPKLPEAAAEFAAALSKLDAVAKQHPATQSFHRDASARVIATIQALCANGDERTLDQALPAISATLGDERVELWLGPMINTAATCSVQALATLWPHLANEALIGPRGKSAALLPKALAQVARLPQACLETQMKRLATLTAFTRSSISRYAFSIERNDLAQFYVALLQSRRADAVGDHLLAILKNRTPPWKGGVVFQTFTRCDRQCRELLLDLLRYGSLNQAEPSTQFEASQLIAKHIASLSLERAGEAWVPRAIEALGSLHTGEAERALHRVLDERKHIIFPLWPPACRDAARRALAERGRSDATRKG